MGSINLQKGQKIDLTKGNPGLTKLLIGLGWDEAPRAGGKGFLSGLLGGSGGSPIDCDASVIMLSANDKLTQKAHLVYFGNLKSPEGSIQHTGDNLTGTGEGDDEQILVDLSRIPAEIQKVVFVVNIYDCQKRKQDFGLISNAFIRVANSATNQELCRFSLTDNYAGKTALICAEVYRYNNEWKFAAIGEGTTDASLGELVRRY